MGDRSTNRAQMDRNLEVYQQEEFDFDSIVLRRADPDDCDQIQNLQEIGKDDVFNRVYTYPKIQKLIETAYLAITVLDREGRVVAFAAFEDYPHGLRGMYDEKHYNCWEPWFKKAFRVTEFSSFNTLWLSYFIAGGSIAYKDQQFAFKKILQTVYTSLSDVIGILFLQRGDCDEEDVAYCFDPLKEYFEENECLEREVLKDLRGIHFNSKVFFSSRVLVLPFIEIRQAKQEDHDDLADVFNSQSETVTEAYGEYFIAELIAAQNEQSKALVAQVKDKAVGLMGLTNEVDVKLLHQCFQLDQFDNLLKPEFMNAIRKRREAILEERRDNAEEQRLFELKSLKEETMKCNIIAQRIALQEFLRTRKGEEEIVQEIDNLLQQEEEIKQFSRTDFEKLLAKWLDGFKLVQPSDYFLEHPTDDYELQCNIQTEQEFLITTLEIFGLSRKYMDGQGHFPDWGKKDKDDKLAIARKRAMAQKMKQKKVGGRLAAARAQKIKKNDEEEQRPTHFDMNPFLKAYKSFVASDGEIRSKLRCELKNDIEVVKSVFVDEFGDPSFKKCSNIMELGKKLEEKGVKLSASLNELIGPILVCFGDIQFEIKEIYRLPEETEEEKRAKALLAKQKEEEEKKEAEEAEKAKTVKKKAGAKQQEEEKEEEKKEEEKKEPPKPIRVSLYQTSIHDLLQALDKMSDFDYILSDLGIMTAELEEEFVKLNVIERLKKRTTMIGASEDRMFEPAEKEESEKPDDDLQSMNSDASRPPTQQKIMSQPTEPVEMLYSDDHIYEEIVKHLEDLDTIPDPPEKAKNAFAITLFCMEAAFDSRSKDFLKYAFDLYPDRDYLIVTQPHTVAENSLLQKFTLAGKKSENTFSHVLYIIHRDQLSEQDLQVQRSSREDLEVVPALFEELDDKKEIFDAFYDATMNPDSGNLSFVCKVDDEVVGAFVMAKNVNLDYYKSHFHIQDSILMSEHERLAHTRLVYSIINPIFEKSTRFILKELLRLTANTCMYFEIHDRTVIPPIFHELIHVRSRRFPHFLDRKWDHERAPSASTAITDDDKSNAMDGHDRDPLDEVESPFALCFTTKRLLSEPKIVKNSRIVVVGASDTGISFIEALLSISYLSFTNIVLIAPGGLPHHHYAEKKNNLKAYSTSYTQQELKRLMLENRVRVINARMTDIDRGDKNVILHDETVVPYDTLILAMGIQDKTLNCLNYVSRGIAPLPKDKSHVEGLLSIDDPYLYQHLRTGGTLMNLITNRKRPQNVVIYGRTLHAYCCIQGLIARGVKPEQITIVIPAKNCHIEEFYDEEEEMNKDLPIINAEAFDNESIEEKIHSMLEALGITIKSNAALMQILEDEQNSLESVVFKLLGIPDDISSVSGDAIDDKSMGDSQSRHSQRTGKDHEMESMDGGDPERSQEEEQVVQKKKRKRNEMELECKLLITCGHKDVDSDVFASIHNNGLVYNGRLIVDKNFQTTDPSIFAAGSLTEFSGRYKALSQGRPLRMDRYNGREMGSRLARSVFDIYDPSLGTGNDPSSLEEELPTFYLPQGSGGVLPNSLIYYHIKTTNPLILANNQQEIRNRADLVCDNLDEYGKGHFIKFTFNSIGLIDSVTYMGSEEIILQSLWSFVGLHENYMNQLTSRYDQGIIPNVSQFLSENWAIALYHEWFGDFCLRMRQGIQGLRDVQVILEKAFSMNKDSQGIDRESYAQLKAMLDPNTVKMIEDETLEFIKTNMNHLPMYYIPGEEFE